MPIPDAASLKSWSRLLWCCSGFAGLTLLADHQSLFTYSDHATLYFSAEAVSWHDLGELLVTMAALTLLCVVLSLLWPRRLRTEGLAAALFPTLIMAALLVHRFIAVPYIFWVWFRASALLAAALIYLLRKGWLERIVTDLLLLSLWIVGANLCATAYRIQTQPEPASVAFEGSKVAGPSSPEARLPRTVVVLLDEFDYRIGFEERPIGFALPELDRLRGEAITMTNAHPAGGWTLGIIPAYLTGQTYRQAKVQGPMKLLIYPSPSGDPAAFDPKQTLFARLHAMGSRISVIGYYHPYCRLFSGLLSDCQGYTNVDASDGLLSKAVHDSEGFLLGMGVQLLSHTAWSAGLTPTIGRALARPALEVSLRVAADNQAKILDKAMREALRAAADPDRDFVFVHLPVPHPPGIGGQLKWWVRSRMTGEAYLDNMIVADGFVAALRETMTKAGLWTSTNVIITSDHALRRSVWKDRTDWIGDSSLLGPGDWGRIPFYLKPVGDGPGRAITKPFPMLAMHDLLLALSRGEIKDMAQAVEWLDASAGRYPLRWPIRTPSGKMLD